MLEINKNKFNIKGICFILIDIKEKYIKTKFKMFN